MSGNFFTRSLFVKVSCIVAAVALVGVMAEAAVSGERIRGIMSDSAMSTLSSIADSKAETITEYVNQQYRVLDAYVVDSDIAKLIEEPENAAYQAAAEEFTIAMSKTIGNLDSILYTDYPGTARTHNQPELVGYQNDADTVALIQSYYFLDPPNPQYSMTSIASPATGNVTLLFIKSLYTKAGAPAGYAALGLTTAKINELLGSISLSKKQEVQLLAASMGSGTIIYDTDASLITTTLESGPLFDIVSKIGVEGETVAESDVIKYTDEKTGEKMMGTYRYLPEYGWMLFVACDETTLYQDANSAATQIIIIAIVVLVFIVISLTLIIKKLLDPLTNVQGVLTDVADYKLNVGDKLDRYKKKSDEIGKLANATSDVVEMLTNAVGVLRNSSDSLNSSSSELDDTSRKLINVTNENTSATQNFSSGIERTTDSVKMVEDEINNIVQLVDNVSEKVRIGENNSKTLIGNAKKMNDQVNKDIEANARTMDETLISMQQAMESLEAVKKINELADSIMSITSQTNLLSLNASIEAARAGEAGRGFAVVASEIGQLAEQSKETAMSIQRIVEDSNTAVDNVKSQVDQLTEYVKTDVTATYESFAKQSRDYGDGIADIQNTVDEIGQAMASLGNSVNGIAREIKAVTNASEENSNGVNDILERNEATERISADIESIAKNSRENANNLEAIVNKFKM